MTRLVGVCLATICAVVALGIGRPAAAQGVVTTYYAPTVSAPVTTYYAPPVTSYYAPTTTYYAPPTAYAPVATPYVAAYPAATPYVAAYPAATPYVAGYAPYYYYAPRLYVPGQPVRNFFRAL
jgi:hypothetical protein